jgi:predicted nucleotidyltransferase
MLPEGAVVIYETRHGSHAYGLAGPDSDLDLRGVFVPPLRHLLGFEATAEQVEPEPERVLYDIRKFFRLAAVCNPTIIEVLFTDPGDHILVAPPGERLLREREAFLSRRAGEAFGGYGLAQLRRIKSHRRWLLDPPKAKPRRADFGLQERSSISADERGAAEALSQRGDLSADAGSPAFIEILDRERRYRSALRAWQQYEEWQMKRNPARAALERQFGYDTKHAMHLMRLLRMGAEILSAGRVVVRRPDAPELLDVRRGALSFDALLAAAERLGEDLRRLVETSPLPPQPDSARINQLCVEIIESTAIRSTNSL